MADLILAPQLPTPEAWWNAIEVFFVSGCLGDGTLVLLRNGPLLIKYDPLFYFAGIALPIYCLTLVAGQILRWMSAFPDASLFFWLFLVIDLLLGLALYLVTYYKVKRTVEPFLNERARMDAAES
jgi:hypothetical protein